MSLIETLSSWFYMPENPADPEDTGEPEEITLPSGHHVPDCHIGLYTPASFEDGGLIAGFLREENHAAIVNLNRMEPVQAQRLIDFLNGALFMIHGGLDRIGSNVYLCANRTDMIRKPQP